MSLEYIMTLYGFITGAKACFRPKGYRYMQVINLARKEWKIDIMDGFLRCQSTWQHENSTAEKSNKEVRTIKHDGGRKVCQEIYSWIRLFQRRTNLVDIHGSLSWMNQIFGLQKRGIRRERPPILEPKEESGIPLYCQKYFSGQGGLGCLLILLCVLIQFFKSKLLFFYNRFMFSINCYGCFLFLSIVQIRVTTFENVAWIDFKDSHLDRV